MSDKKRPTGDVMAYNDFFIMMKDVGARHYNKIRDDFRTGQINDGIRIERLNAVTSVLNDITDAMNDAATFGEFDPSKPIAPPKSNIITPQSGIAKPINDVIKEARDK